MNIKDFNYLNKEEAVVLLQTCCGATKWATLVADKMPYENERSLLENAGYTWYDECNESDWIEAFSHHPKIGDTKLLAEKFASTQHLAAAEQQSVNDASQQILQQLSQLNKDYETKFGFIFIVCATGKPANEMLRLLQDRINNSYPEELLIAMGEQHKITILRLQKLLISAFWQKLAPSRFSTHVLDTSLGIPAKNITARLKRLVNGDWLAIAQGVTNDDGRVIGLLPPERKILHGNYKIVFETESYFNENKLKVFYPQIEIQFTITDDSHYHVPLLINPFGYSTYRGS